MKGFHQIAILLHTGEQKYKSLYNVFLLIFFWSIFDGIIMYVTPLLITEKGYSRTAMGLIIGSSSVFGAFFDFVLSSIFTNIKYRRIFFIMLVLCLVYPFILWNANTIWLFLLAMAWWGLYFNLFNFGRFNFVGRQMEAREHAFGFSILSTARALGILIAPLIAGFLIIDLVNNKTLAAALIFLGVAFLFLFFSYFSNNGKKVILQEKTHRHLKIFDEVKLWWRLEKIFFPVLLFTIFLNVVDAFFWTLGPMVGEQFKAGSSSGLFLAVYSLPALLIGWFIGKITDHFGKQRTAFASSAIACFLLLFFPLLQHWLSLVFLVFLSSLFFAISWPAIGAVYADFISQKPRLEKDIEGLGDLSNNIGYTVGPALAGFLSFYYSFTGVFMFLGLGGFVLSLSLFFLNPQDN